MIKPTVVLVWPSHVDFPLCRANLKRFRDYFKDIYIAFSYAYREEDYRNFIKSDLSFAAFVEVNKTGADWRDNAVNSILEAVFAANNSTHCLFLEQDFLIKDESFWKKVLEKDNDFVFYNEGERIHPSFALVRTDIVQSTHLDFAAHPDDFNQDHFGMFFKEVVYESSDDLMTDLTQLGLKSKEDFYHLNAVTQNYACFKADQPMYRPQEFLSYNSWSAALPDQHPQFLQLERRVIEKLGQGDTKFLKQFFP